MQSGKFKEYSQYFLVVIALILGVLIVLGQANPLTTRLERDSGIFIYVSSFLLEGKTLYTTAWENKPPGIFFIDAVGLALGGGTRWGIWCMEFIFLFGSALAGFVALKKRFGPVPATVASFIWLSGLSLILSGGNFTEEYSLLFGFLALLLFTFMPVRTTALWINFSLGLLCGASFLMRPNNVGVQVSIILTLVVIRLINREQKSIPKPLIVIALGFLLPIAGVALYFLSQSAFQLLIEASFIYNLYYTNGRIQPLGTFISGIRNLGFAAGIALVGVWIALEHLWSQFKDRKIDLIILWICIDFFIEIILSALSGRNYEHYFINWLPWLSFTCAYLVDQVLSSFSQWSRRSPFILYIASIVAIAATNLEGLNVYLQNFTRLATDRSQVQKQELIPEYVNANTLPDETVLVWGGQAGINFLADRASPSPYLLYPLYVPSEFTDRISLEYFQALQANPPELIVDGSFYVPEELVPLSAPNPARWISDKQAYFTPYLNDFFDFFRENYSYETTVGGVAIYRLNR